MVSPPTNPIMKFCYKLSDGQPFEIFITVIILLNMVQMCLDHHNASPKFLEVMNWANLIFSIIYTIEAAIKLIGHRKFYFYKSWNVFDFVIVLAAWFGMLIDSLNVESFINPSILRCFRVFRVARILRIIQMAKGIRRLLYTLVCSLPALMNIGTLLMLIIYIYAVVGVAMFGTVQIQGILTDQVAFSFYFLLKFISPVSILSSNRNWGMPKTMNIAQQVKRFWVVVHHYIIISTISAKFRGGRYCFDNDDEIGYFGWMERRPILCNDSGA